MMFYCFIYYRAIEIWGSKEALEREKKKRKEREDAMKESMYDL